MNNLSTRQRIGLGLAGVYSLGNVVSVTQPTPDGEVGAPFGVLLLDGLLGVVGLVAVVLAWRGSRGALRVAAGCVIVTTLTALPAFFVGVPVGIKLLAAAIVLMSIASVVLMFSPAPRDVAQRESEAAR